MSMIRSLLVCCLLASLPAAADLLRVETVASGLEHPWALVFLDDSRMLISERAGRLRLIINGRLLEEPVAGVPDTFVRAQGGFQDLVLHPRFSENGWIYLTLAHGSASANATRVVRGRIRDRAWVDSETVFTATPSKSTPVHYGARMAFLPDETLLISIGDGFDDREHAQRLDSHLGKIVRVSDRGEVPVDNPMLEHQGALPEIFSYGHRNVQGIVVDPDSGLVWSHEHGPRGGDELNLIRAGANYGWPVATRGVDYSGARVSPYTSRPGMVDPLIDWTPSIAPAGLAQYRGDLFPDWRGDLLVTSLAERSLRRIRIDGQRVIDQDIIQLGLDRRLRDIEVGPDGAIYLLTDETEGAVVRVTPIENPSDQISAW
ncbi:MAG: PQQ-dependent sugar dehydrogenase [Wenzhouxiangella sp.]|jgi:glucose/arabinose dehydrogenase|nr:PQQ-dependent sugar dehydrogenase [Wenzhouxiangella sp.]